MTRKDYELIAAAIADALRAAQGFVECQRALAVKMVHGTAQRIATALAADNPRFDRARFLAACGIH